VGRRQGDVWLSGKEIGGQQGRRKELGIARRIGRQKERESERNKEDKEVRSKKRKKGKTEDGEK
jgi:hypothetical protein